MRLYGVRIFVDDLIAARRFYVEQLGLCVNWEMGELDAFGAALDNAELIVERSAPGDEGGGLVGRFVGVSLQVDDIQAEFEALRARGVTFEGPPVRQPWGGWLAHFRDPAGNVLTLLG